MLILEYGLPFEKRAPSKVLGGTRHDSTLITNGTKSVIYCALSAQIPA